MTVLQGASTRVNSLKYNSAITVFIYSCAFLLSGQDAVFEKRSVIMLLKHLYRNNEITYSLRKKNTQGQSHQQLVKLKSTAEPSGNF